MDVLHDEAHGVDARRDDGAVGLCAVHSAAKQVGAARFIAVGHNTRRLAIAQHLGATHTFDSHSGSVKDEILELTSGGSPHVVEAVGNQESLDLAVGVVVSIRRRCST
jgi:aryl-alcohol dehydrogenase